MARGRLRVVLCNVGTGGGQAVSRSMWISRPRPVSLCCSVHLGQGRRPSSIALPGCRLPTAAGSRWAAWTCSIQSGKLKFPLVFGGWDTCFKRSPCFLTSPAKQNIEYGLNSLPRAGARNSYGRSCRIIRYRSGLESAPVADVGRRTPASRTGARSGDASSCALAG